ncbi:14635_t:CDS:2 [Cetraspora pellucida]|uniref:14635_t:CDS:1 n=1 Tax=Cetraspora pellucida TaxID=1433469 RepID=A0A9N9JX35_9GLOM|nr:14635_t:CDS:2 [Cetraspora pellucida]
MSNKKKKKCLYIPIETNPFTLAAQVTKSTIIINYYQVQSYQMKAEPSINPSKLYCKWYKKAKFSNIFTEDIDWFKEQYLIHYLKSKDHQKAQEIETCAQLTIHESIRKPLSTEKLKVIQNMHNMYWLVENNIATLNIQGLCNLVKMQIQNQEDYITSTNICTIRPVSLINIVLEERCKYGSYSNNHAGHDFIEAIA